MLTNDTIVTLCIYEEDNIYTIAKSGPDSSKIRLYDALHYIAEKNKYALADLVFRNIPIRDRLREIGLRELLNELKAIHPLDKLDEIFNEFYKESNDVVVSDFDIQLYHKDEAIKLWGQEIGNLEKIKNCSEINVHYRGVQRTKEEKEIDWGFHVGDTSQLYPCFDSEDWASEDRYYQNYIIRKSPITDDEMQAFFEIKARYNFTRLHERTPADMLPILYYKGEGDFMLLGTRKKNM